MDMISDAFLIKIETTNSLTSVTPCVFSSIIVIGRVIVTVVSGGGVFPLAVPGYCLELETKVAEDCAKFYHHGKGPY